jgi:4'-phosphopantetheinyl transferase EntD
MVRDLERVSPRGVRIAAKEIAIGDEGALSAEERIAARTMRIERLRASGAARIAARTLLGDFGLAHVALPRGPTGAPRWPSRVVGSLAHDERVAIAAIASIDDGISIGVDVEPAAPLPRDLVEMIATESERTWLGDDRLRARELFCAKEAIYKAIHPLDGIVLDHHDIEVEPPVGAVRGVRVRGSRCIFVATTRAERIAAIAFVPNRGRQERAARRVHGFRGCR